MYGSGLPYVLGLRRARVDHGVWGLAPFQSLYEPAPTLLSSLPQMPEWHLLTGILVAVSALSAAWGPLKLALLPLAGVLVPPISQACLAGARARFTDTPPRWATRLRRRLLTTALHLIQPIARLRGRIQEGLTPWRRRCPMRPGPLWPVTASLWSEHRLHQDQRLRALEARLRAEGGWVVRGERHTTWDLEIRAGCLGAARLLMGVEEHAGMRQLVRVRWWPTVPLAGPGLMLGFAALALGAAGDHAWVAAVILGFGAVLSGVRTIEECAAATAMIREAVGRMGSGDA
jgi:hypothetical protein